jgi:hypothetical protein
VQGGDDRFAFIAHDICAIVAALLITLEDVENHRLNLAAVVAEHVWKSLQGVCHSILLRLTLLSALVAVVDDPGLLPHLNACLRPPLQRDFIELCGHEVIFYSAEVFQDFSRVVDYFGRF